MKKIIVLDAYSLMYRAYHALRVPMSNGEIMTNCIHGFLMMLFKILEEEQPDAACVAFDVHAPTFRHEGYAEYKAGRAPMPEDMRPQVPEIRALLAEMHIPIIEVPGYEADDMAGTVSAIGEREGFETVIVTGDRDSYQLAGPHTAVMYTKKGISETERITPEWIQAQYGLRPEQLIDVKSMAGDASDNIPGIPGVGEKTAVKLITQYGDLETALEKGPSEQKGKLAERLRDNAESARKSYWLAKIVRDAPVEFDFDSCRLHDLSDGLPRMRALRLNQCIERLKKLCPESASAPVTAADAPAYDAVRLTDTAALCAAIDALPGGARLALHVGAEISVADADALLVAEAGGDLLSPGIDVAQVAEAVLRAAERYAAVVLMDVKSLPVDFSPVEHKLHDVMLQAYVLDAQVKSHDLTQVLNACGLDGAHQAGAVQLLMADAYQIEKLRADDLTHVYEDIERPLAFVLRSMEQIGFLTDADVLRRLGEEYAKKIDALQQEIYDMAGERLNLNSPKQLGALLFEKLGLPAGKKKGGSYSTSADVLEELAEQYPICARILEYRRYAKLNSTYVDALLRLRDGSGRIHTCFDQVSTATGRISSLEPNLQNIPVRTEEGRQIRRAFIAPEGCCLVDADYAQIELRVLAHMSGDENMIEAFNSGEDIHRSTAAQVYGVPLSEVTPKMRSSAKAVNFGIVYGISDFGLAKNIGVSRYEAKEFIERYLARYPGVKRYMEDCVESGKRDGYVSTLSGRRRYLGELKSSNYNVRSFGERAAMNSPIQGTAADIIKMAMVGVVRALKDAHLKARLILQVHDELIIECPLAEKDEVCRLLSRCMEQVLTLDVPLPVEVSTGGNWNECK